MRGSMKEFYRDVFVVFFINCIKLIKETAVSACVFGYHRKKQARNLCLRDAVLTGGLLIIGTFIETEFLHENAIVLIPIINGVAFISGSGDLYENP